MLPHPGRARLSPLARTTLLLTVASGALALTPVPSATSLPLPAVTHAAAAHPARATPTPRGHARNRSTGTRDTWTQAAFPRTVLTVEPPATVSASLVTRHAQAVRYLATHH